MVKELIDLSSEQYKKCCLNPFSDIDKDLIGEPIVDSVFGWDVKKAEVSYNKKTNRLSGYSLLSGTDKVQAIAERISSKDIEYWHYEFLDRDVNIHPDAFQPKIEEFLKFFNKEYKLESEQLHYDLSLPVVTYGLSDNRRLQSVRYSLSVRENNVHPLIFITIGQDGFLHTLSHWQHIDNRHIVFPTPNGVNRYLLQDFADSDSNEPGSHKSQGFQTKTIKKTLEFQGLHKIYKVDCIIEPDTEKDLRRYGFYIPELRNILSDRELLLKYIPTINYHILEPCDMQCRHCFSDFKELDRKFMVYEGAKKIVKEIAKIKSFRKLNFSGGEPSLFKGIESLVSYAKLIGIKEVSLVSNGYKLSRDLSFQEELLENLDILALSIDSFDSALNSKIGRFIQSHSEKTMSLIDFENLAKACEKKDVKIKINTVVTKINCHQIMIEKIARLNPIRWKILRMLPIHDQNDQAQNLVPTDVEFAAFIEANSKKAEQLGVEIISENNEDMTGSYLMISPDGRFFNNLGGKHSYSQPILSVGIKNALQETPLMREIFYKRGGDYGI